MQQFECQSVHIVAHGHNVSDKACSVVVVVAVVDFVFCYVFRSDVGTNLQ